jgi:hypothetical protein
MAKNLVKIHKYLEKNALRSFEWGVFDCCTFACDIIVICGGEDFAKDVRGKYKTAIGANRIIKKHFGTLEQAFSSLEEIPLSFAQRGDFTLFETDDGPLMAMRWNEGYIGISPEGGLGMIELQYDSIKTWRVN